MHGILLEDSLEAETFKAAAGQLPVLQIPTLE